MVGGGKGYILSFVHGRDGDDVRAKFLAPGDWAIINNGNAASAGTYVGTFAK